MSTQSLAPKIIESLRRGLPPQRGVQQYAVGHDKLIAGVKRFHLDSLDNQGIIRFVSGSWGAGKTHFFRLMRELSFDEGFLVSGVELNVNEAPLNKFERVFFAIVRNITTPTYFREFGPSQAAPFGIVLREAMVFLATGKHSNDEPISYEHFTKASEILMASNTIDIDFRKIVKFYWETFLPDAPDPGMLEQLRNELLQWFSGEGMLNAYRKRFGVNKLVAKENAKLMLQSLSAFTKLAGYRGLVILCDETEMSYSVMRKSALKDAHNNLLHLINNIEDLPGIFLLYATTPDFYTDPTHGIVIYGALQTRIGKPEDHTPKALEVVWNLDAVPFDIPQYQEAALKIRLLYLQAYPESESVIPDENDIKDFVAKLYDMHPSLSQVRFWRVLTTACVSRMDDAQEGEAVMTPLQTYREVMDVLKES
jgi:hypothetical protein